MTEIKYIGTHQPFGMIVDIDESQVDEKVASNEYERLVPIKKKIIKKEVLKKDDNFERTYN